MQSPDVSAMIQTLRPELGEVKRSGIGEIADYARARGGVAQLWVGEGDQPTPAFIMEAARRSLAEGETFYTWQRGMPECRAAVARYASRHYGRALDIERFSITGSGMQALQIAFTLTVGHGDEVLVPSPAWPNAPGAIGLRGARVVEVPFRVTNSGWVLDPQQLADAVTPRTKAIFFNSPSNPTGWVADQATLRAVLDLARRHGLWIIADEIYSKFYWKGDASRAPSFHDMREDGDRIIFVNTFSKNWAMTGWRAGWIEADASLGAAIEGLIQYSTSGVPMFIQRAATVALDEGDGFVEEMVRNAQIARNRTCEVLESTGNTTILRPDGAFYLFFSVNGIQHTRQLAFDLVDHSGVGLAPGAAFGRGGEHYLRLCYLRSAEKLEVALDRLKNGLLKLKTQN